MSEADDRQVAGRTSPGLSQAALDIPAAGAEPGREDTHWSIQEIVHSMGIKPMERALLWLSKTDLYALGNCTHYTRQTLAGLGLMVLFTTIVAFLSGVTALSIIVDPETEFRIVIALVGASIYAFGILLIDREIVGNPSNTAMLFRVVFALIIATAVSYPMKLKLLEGPIKAEIGAMVEERNSDKLQRVAELRGRGLAEKAVQLKAMDEQLAGVRRLMKELEAQITDERTKQELGARCDKRCERAKAQLVEQQALESKILAEQTKLASDDRLAPDAQAEVDRLRGEIEEQKKASDFLSYWQAQERVFVRDKSGARVLSYFLFGFFFALEMVPLFLKIAMGSSEYHQYLIARSRLNEQKINTVTNMCLTAIQRAKRLEDIMQLPPELTDIICYLMEDSTRPFRLEKEYRDFLAAKRASGDKDGPPDSAPPPDRGAS